MKCAGLVEKVIKHLGMERGEAEKYVSDLTRRVQMAADGAAPGARALSEAALYKRLIAADASLKVREAVKKQVQGYMSLHKGLASHDKHMALIKQGESIQDALLADYVGIQSTSRGSKSSASLARHRIETDVIGPLEHKLRGEHGWFRTLNERAAMPGWLGAPFRAEAERINAKLAEVIMGLDKKGKVKPGAAAVAGEDAQIRSLALDLVAPGLELRRRFNMHGVPTEALAGHITQRWDPLRMRFAGKDKFVKSLELSIDWNHPAYSGMTAAEKRGIIGEVYDNLTSTTKLTGQGGGVGGNIAAHRQIFLKENHWLKVMGEFGKTRNVIEAYMEKFRTETRELSLVERWGPNYRDTMRDNVAALIDGVNKGEIEVNPLKELPSSKTGLKMMAYEEAMRPYTVQNYKKLMAEEKALRERAIAGEDVTAELAKVAEQNDAFKVAARTHATKNLHGLLNLVDPSAGEVSNRTGSYLERAWMTVTGEIDRVGNPTLASVAQTTRALVSMSMLGRAVLSAVADLGVMHNAYMATGRGFGESWGASLTGMAKGIRYYLKNDLGGAEGKRLARVAAGFHESMIGGVYARFSGETPGRLSSVMDLYYKLNLLTPWTDSARAGMVMGTSHWLGEHAGMSFHELPKGLQNSLDQVSLGAREWELIRKGVTEIDGKNMILPDQIGQFLRDGDLEHLVREELDQIGRPGSALTPMPGATEAELRARATQVVRDRLSNLVTEYFHTQVQSGVLGVTDQVKAMTTFGQRGTWPGEVMRMMTQFKSFPVAQAYHTMGGLFFGENLTGLQRGARMTSLTLQMTLLGGVAMTLKDFARGDTPKDFRNPKTWLAAGMQGGALGIYGDLFLANYSRYGQSLPELLAGPTVGAIGTMANIISPAGMVRAATGEARAVSTMKDIVRSTPFVNLLYVKPVLDMFVLNPLYESVQPGVIALSNRNKYKEFGQRSWTAEASRNMGLIK